MNTNSQNRTSRPSEGPGLVVRGWLSEWEPPARELPFHARLALFRLASGRIIGRVAVTALLVTLLAGAVLLGIDDLLCRNLCCLADACLRAQRRLRQ